MTDPDLKTGEDGSNGGRQRSSSKGPSPSKEGEIYTRADGKKVRKVRRSSSAKDGALAAMEATADGTPKLRRLVRSNSSAGSSSNLAGLDDGPKRRIKRSNSSHAGSTHRRGTLSGLLAKDEKGGRRIKRSSSSHSGMPNKDSSLSGFLANDQKNDSRSKLSGSRSIGAGEGQVYTRADGKKGKYKTVRLRARH